MELGVTIMEEERSMKKKKKRKWGRLVGKSAPRCPLALYRQLWNYEIAPAVRGDG